jgi:predicted nucleotidyltransferase
MQPVYLIVVRDVSIPFVPTKTLPVMEMQTRESIMRQLRAVKSDVQARYPVLRLALFGSWARGEQHQGSAIDLLLL